MRSKLFLIALLAVTLAWAQGLRVRQGAGSGNGATSRLNLSQIEVIEGTVSAVDLAYGAQYPSITINQKLIKLAPAWFLLDHDFQIKVGDRLKVTAAPCAIPSDPYYYALTLTNLLSNVTLALRDQNGNPLWTGGRGAYADSATPRAGGGCLNPATITTVTGVVDKVMAGAGLEQPTLVVKTPDGKLIAIKIGPEWILLANDFELKAGEIVTVRYAVATCSDENIALELVNAAGARVVLRNLDGTPAWN
jgi:hypothetical protein